MALQSLLPWTKSPLIINAPMGQQAGAALALAVHQAGGLGQIGSAGDMTALSSHLTTFAKSLNNAANVDGLLPVGVGFLPFITDLEKAVPVMKQHKPAVIWLFAANQLSDYAIWTERMRVASPKSQIWIQAGSVAATLEIVSSAHPPDALCVQGSDAGGHGFEKGASLMSLLPEIGDSLAAAGHQHIPLVAAGGICDARSAAAAFALGAQGVVMGTRFLSSPETIVHPLYRRAVLAAKDGGQYTVRSKLFDELNGPNVWPGDYDGRCITSESWEEWRSGVSIEGIREAYATAVKGEDQGFGLEGKGRAAMWAGTGVGLVKEEMSAGVIVEEVRTGVKAALERAKSRL